MILASWCGKPVSITAIRERRGLDGVSAVRAGRVHEIAPEIILQPGPAALTDGIDVVFDALSA